MTSWDEVASSAAFDVGGPHAEQVRLFAEQALAEGVPADEVVGILRSDDPVTLLTARLLCPGPRLSLEETVARTGMTRDQLDRIRLAGGLPPLSGERVFNEADVASFQLFGSGAELFGEEPLLQFVRVAGSSLARIAEAAIALYWTRVEGPLTEQRVAPDVIAKSEVEATQLLAAMAPVLDSTFRLQAELAISRMDRARRGAESFETGRLAIGFVDLVGFTSVSEQLNPARLGEVVDEFEGFAFDVVTEHDARLVKLIGDAVMFVAVDVDDACEIALTLTEHFRDDANPVTPRGGLALGDMLIRGGDYYGPIVNLASRASELAVSYEILVTETVVDAAGPSYRFEPAGRRALKGFAQPVQLASLGRG